MERFDRELDPAMDVHERSGQVICSWANFVRCVGFMILGLVFFWYA